MRTAAAYEDKAQELTKKIDALRSHELVVPTEDALNQKLSSFREFLELMSSGGPPGADSSDVAAQMAKSLALFVRHWLAVFREASIDPVAAAGLPCAGPELLARQTIPEVCSLVLKSLEGGKASLFDSTDGFSPSKSTPLDALLGPSDDQEELDPPVGQWSTRCTWFQVWRMNPEYTDKPGTGLGGVFPVDVTLLGFAKVRVLTGRHLVLLLLLGIGFVLSVYMVLTDFVAAWLCLVAQGIVITLLQRFESLDVNVKHGTILRQLASRNARLKADFKNLEKRLGAIAVCQQRSEKLLRRLWRCRTLPQLQVLQALQEKLTKTPWKDQGEAKAFLDFAVLELQRQASFLGELAHWCGSESDSPGLDESACSLFKDQLDRCAAFLRQNSAEACLASRGQFQLLNFVAVRIVGCQGLQPAGCLCTSPILPYVQVRIGGDPDGWLRTAPSSGCAEPKWHYAGQQSEFHLNAATEPDAALEVSLMDASACLGCGDDATLGTGQLVYQALEPAKWHSDVTLTLEGSTDGVLVELEVFVATAAEHLLGISPFLPEEDRDYDSWQQAPSKGSSPQPSFLGLPTSAAQKASKPAAAAAAPPQDVEAF
eukprot:TRINITY_DN26507_c0_g1_i1.p1 TRINITY_DN26507_c0_g1~~TRINITY_DN26507_c0_g1_i1.p1  ORF type:complete len:598 (+),score=140.81 TRINITY_DN26507_c0_g1_i1:324-2117(+)